MSDETEPLAYIARKSCGCFIYAGIDTPTAASENAREIAWCIRKGYTIERVTVQYVRENWRSSCEACKPIAAHQEVMQL